MTRPDRRLRIPAELERLAEVRKLVRDATRAAGAQPGTVDDLVQAVDEAAANTITHGYSGDAGWVEVTVAVSGDELVVKIGRASCRERVEMLGGAGECKTQMRRV